MKTIFKLRGQDKEGVQVVEFYLDMTMDGDVALKASLEDGSVWRILNISKEGLLSRYNCVSEDIGIQTDKNGRIILNEGY